MIKTGYRHVRVTSDRTFNLTGVTSLTVSNHGGTKLKVFDRELPAIIGKNPACFKIDGDGTQSDLDFIIEFEGGRGEAYLDYKRINDNC
ncbi:hypothetical protein [Flavobacterium sp. UBA4197]|uniref:hypothetical protein n=1 Tax=Flavobacterium sp. UBA4197 TaxID=1946546 RepID=UPI00257EE152|nr:hypothetical protein [Flavobacterium sp. UBA4197]HRB72435.1 hypothetical protein [Flavobacterium sp.]